MKEFFEILKLPFTIVDGSGLSVDTVVESGSDLSDDVGSLSVSLKSSADSYEIPSV